LTACETLIDVLPMKLDGASLAYRINKTNKYADTGHGVTID
jgi:hypothetical protein